MMIEEQQGFALTLWTVMLSLAWDEWEITDKGNQALSL